MALDLYHEHLPAIYRSNRPLSSELHPKVYAMIVGLAVWFVLSAWGFVARNYVAFALVAVSAFVFAFVALPAVLGHIGRRARDPRVQLGHSKSLAQWLEGDFDTWQGRLKAKDALIGVLCPIAAGAFGMTAFALILHFSVR